MTQPLAVDIYCGLGGWTEGLLEEGYRVIGFDNERHVYGDERYPAQLVIQDVRTIHGRQFKDAALIVASPPCQAYSYRAMPWKRAKALPPPSNELFEACFRIQAEAIEAAGHFIPLVVENVRGAQKYVGRSKYHFGSFHLWGDVPALMPMTRGRKNLGGSWFNVSHNTDSGMHNPVNDEVKVGGFSWSDFGKPGYKAQAFNGTADQRLREGEKTSRLSQKRDGHSHTRHLTNQAEHCICPKTCDCQNPDGNGVAHLSNECPIHNYNPRYIEDCPVHDPDVPREGCKQIGSGAVYFDQGASAFSSRSRSRKRASALIAKIPLVLSRHIAASWYPHEAMERIG